jgi:hypothetical protein
MNNKNPATLSRTGPAIWKACPLTNLLNTSIKFIIIIFNTLFESHVNTPPNTHICCCMCINNKIYYFYLNNYLTFYKLPLITNFPTQELCVGVDGAITPPLTHPYTTILSHTVLPGALHTPYDPT